MKLPLSWLREFVPDAPDAQRVADALTLGGFPVEHVETIGTDTVLDVEVTSNRGDCLSIVGVAREVAALLKLRFEAPRSDYEATRFTAVNTEANPGAPVAVSIDAPDACAFYSASEIKGVKVAPSPAWLAERLEAVGVRPINNVVDVTNYVLFELGQPLHAFDRPKVGDAIRVRFAGKDEQLETLDHVERKLAETNLVIADEKQSLALAGVMGGVASGVTDQTTDVLLEAARFDPLVVRKTARGLALASDSSYRFERGLDPTLAGRAMERATQLILDLAGGTAHGTARAGSDAFEPIKLTLRRGSLRRILGVDWPIEQLCDALGRLGFSPTIRDDCVDVTVPGHRLDVRIERDLIEEVARVVGYEHIPTRDDVPVRLTQREPARVATDVMRTQLHAHGYFEAMTFSFVSDTLADAFQHQEATRLHRVESATRKTDARLRPSILPNLLESLRHNENNGVLDAKLYETASVFWIDANGASLERRAISLVGGDYRGARGTVEAMLQRLDKQRPIRVEPAERKGFGAWACGRVLWGDVAVGYVGVADRAVAEKVGLRELPAMAELWLEPLIAGFVATPTLTPLPRFPAVRRDLSLLVKESVAFAQIESLVGELRLDALEAVEFVTTYRGKPLEKGQKSVTIALSFRKPDGTLTGGEVDDRIARVTAAAGEKLGATLRA